MKYGYAVTIPKLNSNHNGNSFLGVTIKIHSKYVPKSICCLSLNTNMLSTICMCSRIRLSANISAHKC